jgi:SAM-dependent methyltransferase
MPVFEDYARYYNLLYADKDYAGETGFVLERLQALGCKPQTLLDLGCGTGRHALEFARRGIAVEGVDMSPVMLEMGRRQIGAAASSQPGLGIPVLHEGDARSVRLGKTFDAVTSLFHVMSYQNSEEDALAVMETARVHLRPGGIFFFDFWYGPGVLTDPPTERDKTMEDAATLLRRHAQPVHRVHDNIVEVHYAVRLSNKSGGEEHELREVHSMRYWFLPELRHLARCAGFAAAGEGAWLSDGMPTKATWNVWMALSVAD